MNQIISQQINQIERERDAFRAENERLRAAIEGLRSQMPHWVANVLGTRADGSPLGSDNCH